MAAKKTIAAPMYLRPEQMKRLDAVAERLHIPRAVLVREAVDLLLEKYKLKGGAK